MSMRIEERPAADTSAVEKLLAEIPSEGEATEVGLQDGPAASPAEKPKSPSPEAKEEAKAEPKAEEEKTPFHKHPRWKAMREENKRKDEELKALKASVEELKSLKESKKGTTSIPQEFRELFGEDEDHWQKFQRLTTSQAEAIVNARFQQMEAQQAKVSQESERWTKWVDEQMSTLADETGLDLSNEESTERNEILKVALDYSPTDKDGNIDLVKSYELWKVLKGQSTKSEEKKKIAALTVEEKADATKTEKTVGLGELKGKNWRDFLPN